MVSEMENKGLGNQVYMAKNKYYNESLADLVKNVSTKNRILEYNGEIIQQINPIFADPKPKNVFDYRAQFFSPTKSFLGVQMDTFIFNILVIWLASGLFYITLYYEWLRKLINAFGELNLTGKMALPKVNFRKKK
jgi:hypothetical protein